MMKRLLAMSAMILCFATLNQSAFGQKKPKSNFFAGNPGEKRVEMRNQSASSDGQSGALIEWQTSYEVNNLGFNIYRINSSGKKTLVNENIISGSALMFGNDTALKAGYSYNFFDKDGSLDNQYVIEAMTTDGKTQNFSNFSTSYAADFKQLVPEASSASVANLTSANVSANTNPAPIASERKANAVNGSQDTQRYVAAQPGVKISVCDSSFNVNRPEAPNCKGAGIYRITKAQLQTGGFDVTVPVDKWALYFDANEQALNVFGDVDANGRLGDNGYIEFYGHGTDTLYTNAKVYYLIVGAGGGKRMKASNVRALPTKTTSPSYPAFSTRQDKTSYAPAIFNGDASNFFGPLVGNFATADSTILGDSSPGAKYKFNLNSVNTQTPAVIDVSVQGLSSGVHVVDVFLNNTKIGIIACYQGDGSVKTCQDKDLMRSSFSVSGSLLLEGQNVVKLSTTDGNDLSFTDYVRVNFGRGFRALNNSIAFSTINGRGATIGGFSNSNIRVFDIADQNNVGFVKNRVSSVVNGGTTTYSSFVQATRARTMIAITDDAVLTPLSIVKNNPSDLLTVAGNKDLVIISYKDFLAQAEELAAYRRGQGLTVSVVDVEDVFDEFSFGEMNNTGLGNFVKAATPKYVLLFGDATTDPRNFFYKNFPNYVPTTLVDTGYAEVPTDEKTFDTNGDAIAEIPVGRLSVVTAAEAQTMVNKIKSYEAALVVGTTPLQQRGALLISDECEGYNFVDSSATMKSHLAVGTKTSFVTYTREVCTPTTNGDENYYSSDAIQVKNYITTEVNKGRFLVFYAGHGTNAGWSNGSILTIRRGNPVVDDTASFTNANDKLSLFILLTCLNGSFADIAAETFSERQMKNANGSAVGIWSSSGLTIPESQDPMGIKFFDLYSSSVGTTRLGDLTRQAKFATGDPDVRYSWVLLGDPTLKIK